ncbi:helix-turn-helix transcriptional regulator [Aquicoccus sp. SCR17]|nr:helix-turn-helix transcriptional regulator [Carideicomes alvinocaridis]
MRQPRSRLQATSEAVRAIGTPGYLDRLIDLVAAQLLHDKVTVVRYSATQRPEFVSWHNYEDRFVEQYLDGFYVFDPFYADWRQNRRPGVVSLRRTPELAAGPYIADFLGESGIVDEVGVLLEDGGDWCLGIFLDRSRQRYRRSEIDRFREAFPLMAAIHGQDLRYRPEGFRRTSQSSAAGEAPGVPARLLERHPKLAQLTDREREIVALILSGQTGGAIATALAIEPGTVKNHKSNIYRKFGIGSERELFVDFMRHFAGAGEGAAPPPPAGG